MAIPGKIVNAVGSITSATSKKMNEVYAAAQKAGHAPWWMWGYDPNASNTEHHSRRAIDFMVRDKADGDWIRAYLWANRKRLGVRHIIWRQHITSTVVQPGVVRKMADRGNTTANHMDHVHVWFLDDRYASPNSVPATSPAKPKPKPVPSKVTVRTLRLGVKGNDVKKLQSEMNRVFPAYSKLAKDGSFGPATERVVKEFQRRVGLSADGRVGPKTRAALKKRGVRL